VPLQCSCHGNEYFCYPRNASVGTSYGPVSVSVCHKPEFYQKGLTINLFFGVKASFDQSYSTLCFKEAQVSTTIMVLPSGTFS